MQKVREKHFRYKAAEAQETKLILTQWTYIVQIREEGNKGVKKYKAKGKTRDHEFMKAKAFQDMEDLGAIQDSDPERVQLKICIL